MEGTFLALWVSEGRCESKRSGSSGCPERGRRRVRAEVQKGKSEKQARGQGSSARSLHPPPGLPPLRKPLALGCLPAPTPLSSRSGCKPVRGLWGGGRLGVHRVGGGEQSHPPVLAELALAPRGP